MNPLNRFIYYPMRYPEGDWFLQGRVGARDVRLRTADNVQIDGWWFAGRGSEVASLFLHGNAGNVTHRVDHALAINKAGSSVLIIDYRGYGKSQGTPDEVGLYRDADAGYDWLVSSGFSPDMLVLHGESLGTAVATEVASRRRCAALVLESPFASLASMANKVLPFIGGAFVHGFDTVSRIGNVRVPKLIIHGEADEIVPISQGRAVFNAAKQPKTFWPIRQAGHNDLLYAAGEEYARRLQMLYQAATAQRR